MSTLSRIVLAVLLGVLVGLAVTIRSLDQANKSYTAGPWRGSTREGVGEIDPYALAANARSGLLPLGAAEGLSFVAEADTKGGTLSSRCDYTVSGSIPAARFWTLTLLSPDGVPVDNPAKRHGFTSAEILRFVDEPVSIDVTPQARGGNWLPSGRGGRFVLMLRLYDTGLSTVGATLNAGAMPKIARLACR